MRLLLLTVFLCTNILAAQAQTKADTIQQIRNNVSWYDLDFTDAEADSMMSSMNNYLLLYKSMHKTLPANDIPYPFAFNPAPPEMKISTKKEKIYWDIPLQVEVPANKNDLAFYSIPQLASLILNKKIRDEQSKDAFFTYFFDMRNAKNDLFFRSVTENTIIKYNQ